MIVARASLRRRLTQPMPAPVSVLLLRCPLPPSVSALARRDGAGALLQQRVAMSTAAPVEPKLQAAKALAARLRRKNVKKKVVVKVVKVKDGGESAASTGKARPAQGKTSTISEEEEALLAAASNGESRPVQHASTATSRNTAGPKATAPSATVAPKAASAAADKDRKTQQQKPTRDKAADEAATNAVATTSAPMAELVAPLTAPKKQPKTLKDLESDKITLTLKEIETLQKTLPSVEEIAALVTKLRRDSFAKGQTLFDLYRIFGNPFLDEQFLTPGVLACCESKKPAQGIQIVRDMLSQGRKVDEATLRALFDVCDETSAAVEVIELWELMERAGFTLDLKDYNRLLDICHRKENLDGAIKVLKVLRLHRSISVHTYMHWLNQAALVWRSGAFFDLLMEMRLSGVEPEISSLTSLESGRMDRALTVMEGVRAVGLDPCFAMSAVFSSMQYSVYKNGPSAEAITKSDVQDAKAKFGDLRPVEIDWPVKPIPQVLETQAAGLILQQETFRRLKLRQVHRIDELLQMLPITTNMTINLRKQLQRMSLLVNTHRVKRDARKIGAEYNSGKTLIELSSVHNYPPVSLMRIILKGRGLSTHGVKRALGNPSAHLSKRDQYELRKATEYDSIHKSDPWISASMYNADSLETTIEHFLRARGIRFKTEDELGDEQSVKYGRRVLSPDILLLDPVIVNGTPIRWIDAKNYYGAHIVSKRLISRQLASYVKEWGPGAIVFGMGYSDMFSLPGVICLDTTPFPKTRTEIARMRSKAMFQSFLNMFSWRKHLGSELTQEYPMHVDPRSTRSPRAIEHRTATDEDVDQELEAELDEALTVHNAPTSHQSVDKTRSPRHSKHAKQSRSQDAQDKSTPPAAPAS